MRFFQKSEYIPSSSIDQNDTITVVLNGLHDHMYTRTAIVLVAESHGFLAANGNKNRCQRCL